ncbi:uncharacterized protein N7482_000057 [Penicillium canariense]|uniref:Phosphoglycerate mutase family protein n=1 Tax=Penicillium canariense TaxID=189055 RepID=A0A9W9IB35_9EURO|nr:uncharacterized protein N7482_000057 [Penicillium canariense]KAJ5174180.1 hypothetical protein N7482_000057 [Penicillium canariense]
MTEAPPIVFIARHGARLDAADKDWHLTSPTPYDPPLSYGGWNQARALGVRIASLLRAPEFTGNKPGADRLQSPASDTPTTSLLPPPASSDLYNQYNVIIHTSPYLRCIQTAIGVSAGLQHYRPGAESPDSSGPTPVSQAEGMSHDPRPLLRVDAFLGEWLSPDYFDQIVPPPASDRMVASAKAELLRRGEVIPVAREGTRALSGNFPGGWGSQSHPTSPNEDEDRCLPSQMSSTTSAQQPQRQRASTFDTPQNALSTGCPPKALGRLNTDRPPIVDAAYVPPTPGYAVSPSDPIPAGYVAHARDACTKIDYQWDSMRAPYWGTGGEYGEEWSSMHERVHTGFRHMVDWYRQQSDAHPDRSRAMFNGTARKHGPAQTVLIIITHGADCNALVSCLAGRPVLLDIGTASVTLAVQRDRVEKCTTPDSDRTPDPPVNSSSPGSRNDQSVSQEYTLQLIASSDHLRAGVNPSQLTSLASPLAPPPLPPPPPIPSYRNRLGSRASASTLQGSFMIDPTPKGGTSSRSWSTTSRPSPSATFPRGSSGLWGSISSPVVKDDEEAEDDFVPNFGDPRPVSHGSSHSDAVIDRSGWTKQLPQRTLSQRGLWGSAPSLEDHDAASRRRWTVAEQKL